MKIARNSLLESEKLIKNAEKTGYRVSKGENINSKTTILSKNKINSDKTFLETFTKEKGKNFSKAETILQNKILAKKVGNSALKTSNKAEIKSEAQKKMKINTKNENEFELITQTKTELARGWVMIQGRGNLCIKSGVRKRIRQASCNWHRSVQWRFIRFGDKWIIQNRNGYVLDNYAWKRNNGAPVYTWNRRNGNNQRWTYSNIGEGKFMLKGSHSGKCLDNTGRARRGRYYHLWRCNKRNGNQHFRLITREKKVILRGSGAPSGWGKIKGKGNLCIKTSKNRRVTQGRCHNNNNYLWRFIRMDNVNIIQNKNGEVLDVFAWKRNNGTQIYAWDRKNGNNQKWKYLNIGDGKFELKNVHSNKCLDNTGKVKVGQGYQQWDCNKNNANQHFRFIILGRKNSKIKKRSLKPGKKNSSKKRRIKGKKIRRDKNSKGKRNELPSGWGIIKGKGNFCIQTSTKAKITQGPCSESNSNNLWKFIRMGSNYVIQNKNGQVIDLYTNKKNNGAHIYAWDRKNGNNQKWRYVKVGGGKFELKSVHSGKCLDNTGKMGKGIGYHQWDCKRNNSNQHFKFILAEKFAKINAKKVARKEAKKKDISKRKTIKLPQGKVYLSSANNLCVKYMGYRKRVIQQRCTKNSNMLWEMVSIDGDTYQIKNIANKFLDTRKGKKNGSTVSSWNKGESYSQHWTILKAKNGKYLIQNRLSRKCLDNTGLARPNRIYWTWTCNENNINQQFTIVSEKAKPPRYDTKIAKNPKSQKFLMSVKIFIRAGKIKQSRKLINKLKLAGEGKSARELVRIANKAARIIKRATRIIQSRIKKLIIKGKAKKAQKLKKAIKKMKIILRNISKGKKGGKTRKGKKKPNSGYRKKKNIKFMGGKYKFNLNTGRDFCSQKCEPNREASEKKCFNGSIQPCNSCQFRGMPKNPFEKDSDNLCKTVCNAIKTEKTCEFYAYIDDKKKIINKKLLNRFGRIFINKYLRYIR